MVCFLKLLFLGLVLLLSSVPAPNADDAYGTEETVAPVPAPIIRTLVAVQGVVYCKSCKYQGIDTLLGASPLSGAVVRLQCNNSKYPQSQEGITDKNGYFLIQGSKQVTSYGVHKCKVFLVSSPLKTCNKATDLHFGVSGAKLKYQKQKPQPEAAPPLPFTLFTVGPFAFDSTSCPH